MNPKPKQRKTKWIRDGTIVCGGDVQIDIRPAGQYKIWLTVKAPNAACEKLSARLLKYLNH